MTFEEPPPRKRFSWLKVVVIFFLVVLSFLFQDTPGCFWPLIGLSLFLLLFT